VGTEAEQALYAEGLDQIERLNDARRMRFVAAEEGLPAGLWAVLVFGGGGGRLHLPLWPAKQLGAQANGDVADCGDRAGTIHDRGDGVSVLWRSPP
jgi:hypothetical protein